MKLSISKPATNGSGHAKGVPSALAGWGRKHIARTANP